MSLYKNEIGRYVHWHAKNEINERFLQYVFLIYFWSPFLIAFFKPLYITATKI